MSETGRPGPLESTALLRRKWDKAKAAPGWDDAKIEFTIMFDDRFQLAN